MIYAVRDSDANVRYVGKTTLTADYRFARHRVAALREARLPLARWLLKHPEAYVTVLETTDDLNAAERRWIAYFGLDTLLNVAAGGNGGRIPGNAANRGVPRRANTPEQIDRWRAAREATGWSMKPRTPEHAAALSVGIKAMYARLRAERTGVHVRDTVIQ